MRRARVPPLSRERPTAPQLRRTPLRPSPSPCPPRENSARCEGCQQTNTFQRTRNAPPACPFRTRAHEGSPPTVRSPPRLFRRRPIGKSPRRISWPFGNLDASHAVDERMKEDPMAESRNPNQKQPPEEEPG